MFAAAVHDFLSFDHRPDLVYLDFQKFIPYHLVH